MMAGMQKEANNFHLRKVLKFPQNVVTSERQSLKGNIPGILK